jgi:hypothetical protein
LDGPLPLRPADAGRLRSGSPALLGFPSFMCLFPLSWKQSKGSETLYMTVVPNGARRTQSTEP